MVQMLLPRGLLFDMDGTITEPMLDFAAIKAEMGIGERPILEALAEMTADARKTAEAILLRHEEYAAAQSTLNAGCHALLDWADRQQLRTALITRNSRASADAVLAKHQLRFDCVLSREFGAFKPNPAPLLEACRCLSLRPADCWMIGDGQHDLDAAVAAGIRCVWLSHGRIRPFQHLAWQIVRSLDELLPLLQSCGNIADAAASDVSDQ